AASIFSATGAVACFEQTAAEILNQFEPVYQSFLTGGAETFLNDYRKNCVTLGHMVKVSGGGRELEGLALDVFPDGRLAVKTETGVEKVEAGDVSVRGIMGYSDL
ncbi:MAG TPA: hypothetical protein VHR42_00250, partial [Clostridia bacterium]|nr:hypothetical protein [Clostridia bacterium]